MKDENRQKSLAQMKQVNNKCNQTIIQLNDPYNQIIHHVQFKLSITTNTRRKDLPVEIKQQFCQRACTYRSSMFLDDRDHFVQRVHKPDKVIILTYSSVGSSSDRYSGGRAATFFRGD